MEADRRGTFSPPGFAAPLGLKDIRLLLQAADDLCVPLPLASLFRDRFLTLLANGRGEALDWSAIGGLAARDAGVDLVSGNCVSDQAAPVPSAIPVWSLASPRGWRLTAA